MKKLITLLTSLATFILIYVFLSKPKAKKVENKKSKVTDYISLNKSKLNSRQVLILKELDKKEKLYPNQIYELLPEVSSRTIRRDMTHLVNLGLVTQQGSTRDTRYLLNI